MTGQVWPAVVLKHVDNALAELGGRGKFGAEEGRDPGRFVCVSGHVHRHVPQAVIAHDLATDQECIPLGEGGRKSFFNLAQSFAAPGIFHSYLKGFSALDRADIPADTLGRARVSQLPKPI